MTDQQPAGGPDDTALTRWTAAGLIEPALAARIRAFEAERSGRPGVAAAPAAERPSVTELLANLGVVVVLGGILTLLFANDVGQAVRGAAFLIIAACGYAGARYFSAATAAAAQRASGSCAALCAVALGTAAGEFGAATGMLTRSVTTTVYDFSYTDTSQALSVLLGAAVVAVLTVIAMRHRPPNLSAVVFLVAVYTAAGAACDWIGVGASDPNHGLFALATLTGSAVILLVAEGLRGTPLLKDAGLSLVGVAGATLPLYALGGTPYVYLDVLGGVLSVGAVTAGIMVLRPGIAWGGVIGIGGLIIDVGARNFSDSATSLAVFLIVAGGTFLAGVIVINRVVGRYVATHRSRA